MLSLKCFFLKSSTFYFKNFAKVLLFIYIFCICYFICLHLNRYNEQSTCNWLFIWLILGRILSENTDNMRPRIGQKNFAHADRKNLHHPSRRAVWDNWYKKTCGRECGCKVKCVNVLRNWRYLTSLKKVF